MEGAAGGLPPEVRATYVTRFGVPEPIHAICEQYRAAATLDYQHDEADRGRRRPLDTLAIQPILLEPVAATTVG